jgi:hypothetical protein
MPEEEKEQLDFEGCNINILRKNGKVAVSFEHSKPMALIALAGFIHLLGQPLGHNYEEGEDYVLFLFEDKPDVDAITQRWHEVFGHGK